MVQKNGEWVFRSTEDPVLKLMRDQGVITKERYNEVSAKKGKNWIEPADAVLNYRREMEWTRYMKTATHLPDWVDLGLSLIHISEPTRLLSISYAVFCLKKKKKNK